MKQAFNKKILAWLIAVVLVLALTVGGCAVYILDYYRADLDAIAVFAAGTQVTKTELSGHGMAYGDPNADAGLIFYPGGKVEYTAYEPLMVELASHGMLCILLEVTMNLAVLDVNAAEGIIERYPDVEHWYIGGHSLGGTVAAMYDAKRSEDFDGIILLGSYSSTDLSGVSQRALLLYGSEDEVMNREKYHDCKSNLPQNLTEIEIEGACHAYFGMYGAQKGDGTPTMSPEEQIRLSADHIAKFIFEGGN